MTPFINTIQDINNKLVVYAECSNKMIDYAFLGKTFNFTKCYTENISNVEGATCYIDGNYVVCNYKGNEYRYKLEGISKS